MEILIESTLSVNEQELETKPEYISDNRWEKIRVIKPIEDKKRSFLAGRLLNKMYKALGINNPEYATEKSGKPYLRNYQDVVFSISHSGEYVALAYDTNGVALGLDIQQIRKMSDGLRKRILHQDESIPKDFSQEEQNYYLNRVWAIKESYVKMTGDGLSQDFRKLYIDMEKGTVTDEKGRSAYFNEPKPPEGYVLALSSMVSK